MRFVGRGLIEYAPNFEEETVFGKTVNLNSPGVKGHLTPPADVTAAVPRPRTDAWPPENLSAG